MCPCVFCVWQVYDVVCSIEKDLCAGINKCEYLGINFEILNSEFVSCTTFDFLVCVNNAR